MFNINLKRKSKSDIIFNTFLIIFMIFFVVITLYPILNTLAISFNDGIDSVKRWRISMAKNVYTKKLSNCI